MCIASLLPIHIGSGASSPAILRRTLPAYSPATVWLRQRCSRCTGTTTKPSKAWLPASIAPAKLGFQPALLRCIQHHPPQLSHREQLGTTLGVKRLLASTHHRLSRKLQQSVRLSSRHQTPRWRTTRTQSTWAPAAPSPAFSMLEALETTTSKSPSQAHTFIMDTLPTSMNGNSGRDFA